jgi:hypothetical protein
MFRRFSPKLGFFEDLLYTYIVNLNGRQLQKDEGDGREGAHSASFFV